MRALPLIFLLASALCTSQSWGQGQSPFAPGSRLTQPPDLSLVAPNAFPEEIRYGSKHWQKIEFYPAASGSPAPLVIAFGHGLALGWPRHRFNEAGIALAWVPNRDPVPKASKTIDNYLAAMGHIYREAERHGIDRDRIVLLGSGNGGSMATLIGTDPALAARAGVPFDSLRGVISIGGEDFDVPRRMAESAHLRSLYRRFYSRDDAELANLSPVSHLALPNAPAFLMLAGERDESGIAEGRRMAQALAAAGASADYVTLPPQREGYRPSYFMAEADGSGHEVMPFLQMAFARELRP